MKNIKTIALLILFVIVLNFLLDKIYTSTNDTVSNENIENKYISIVIDPGHGGDDPGKVSDIVYEKELNLKISLKLKEILTKSGFVVIMTREEDKALGESNKSPNNFNKKEDMRTRIEIIEKYKPDIFVSIHCNSYNSKKTKGAQTFYNKNVENSKILAECIQNSIIQNVDTNNRREIKEGDFYVTNNEICPAVIVEVGFMSNEEELNNLLDEKYQTKIAKAISYGIINYFNK